jgi:hypothetical protein
MSHYDYNEFTQKFPKKIVNETETKFSTTTNKCANKIYNGLRECSLFCQERIGERDDDGQSDGLVNTTKKKIIVKITKRNLY